MHEGGGRWVGSNKVVELKKKKKKNQKLDQRQEPTVFSPCWSNMPREALPDHRIRAGTPRAFSSLGSHTRLALLYSDSNTWECPHTTAPTVSSGEWELCLIHRWASRALNTQSTPKIQLTTWIARHTYP